MFQYIAAKNNDLILVYISLSASKGSLEIATGVSEEEETGTLRGGRVDCRPILATRMDYLVKGSVDVPV